MPDRENKRPRGWPIRLDEEQARAASGEAATEGNAATTRTRVVQERPADERACCEPPEFERWDGYS
jgi:hypothetical protein